MNYHKSDKDFVANGRKQLRIIAALYDNEKIRGLKLACEYRSRSAALLRNQVKSALSKKDAAIDRHIRIYMQSGGPKYVNRCTLGRSLMARRVGNLCYGRDFARAFFKNFILSHASFRDTGAKFIMTCQSSCTNELASLLPDRSSHFWGNVAEDIWLSPDIQAMQKELPDECESHSEFAYLSIDGTVKCCLPLLGQATYRDSAAVRADQAVADCDAAYKVLTVRGRTSAVLLVEGIHSEAGAHIATMLEAKLTQAQRIQI